MYEYKFEKIEVSSWTSKPKSEYQELIQENARNGWRFVQIFAPGNVANLGSPTYFELIFERPLST